ncbi:c-type cytochrome biogenesis protein CcsB [Riemerella columbipharyngis]|uniref:Cytochrome c-type biogenesis protein CcsB n=1 Tax=Riemerella columbipharyngis TaxID=1071918 RepID=A0A1G6YDI9_9FLAO|nr:c-type cytochrome biogenesis protein CcsB [Riemerella columbipharyngis]SDD88438.1 cytochrome c-type biogenesis protein CcsB [Riemerella columbipharyngis]
MEKLQKILISTRTMAVLLLVYAISMAYATFLENDFGTPAAKAYIYNSWWFSAIMFLLIINFIANIPRYRLWKKEKWPLLVFHLSFILLFIGGAITRYISYEGQMHIRQGDTSNQIVSDRNYFKIKMERDGDVYNYQDIPYIATPKVPFWTAVTQHNFRAAYDFNGEKIKVTELNYVPRKKDSIQLNPSGKKYLHFVTTDNAGRLEYYIEDGEVKNIGNYLVTLNRKIDGAIEFKTEGDKILIKAPIDASYLTMATQTTGTVRKDTYEPLALRSLYSIDQLKIVVPNGIERGNLISYSGDKVKEKNLPDEMTVEVQGQKSKQIVKLTVQDNTPGQMKQINVDGINIMLGYGSKVYTTPFALKLDEFILKTYPGSSSPSSFESKVKIIDNGTETPFRIYMNHILNYRGYRFFQSSFDPDRKGTILSVNHDYWGTLITYIGYALLFLGMFVTLFWKGTRFWELNKRLRDIAKKRGLTVLIFLLAFGFSKAQNHTQNTLAPTSPTANRSAEEILKTIKIDKHHAEEFGSLLVQSYDGRIEPINTQALDVLRKLTAHDSYEGIDANQWFLDAVIISAVNPMILANLKVIKVESQGNIGKEIEKKARANADGYTSLINLYTPDTNGMPVYVFEDDYNKAFRKKASEQTKYDQAVIKLNDKVQVMNSLMNWQYFRVVPVQNDPNHRWNSVVDAELKPDSISQKILGPYVSAVVDATQTHNWKQADVELKKLKDYQMKWGKSVIPSDSKIKTELLLNKLDINFILMIFYTVIAVILIVLGFVELFKPHSILHKIIKMIIALGILGYIVHFVGLVARWYVSGHAPWSNGYEAIMFISWIGITAGLLLYRNGNALIPCSGFMVAVLLMGFAHGALSLNPQITPLVPVLKSYWLVVHVAIITSSYGFFALSFIIGSTVLIFYILTNKKVYKKHHDTTIKELGIVSEMSLTVGLFLLTIGTFLGGIWANESWGRYWSWDPKETWAFISVMVYAFVLHMRLVPGLRGAHTFHMVTMFAFSSVVMTYFGVNYYLTGLHSYAAGDPIPIPIWVYITTAVMIALSVWSWIKYKELNRK